MLIISACTTITQNNGAEIRQVKLDQLTQDSSKADVFNMLGSPSTKSVYGEETWYYITNQIKRQLIKDDKVISESVIAISFNGDKIDTIQTYGTNDKEQFDISDRVTPTAGKKLSAVEQLLGNVGKFNTDDASNSIGTHSPGGAGTIPGH